MLPIRRAVALLLNLLLLQLSALGGGAACAVSVAHAAQGAELDAAPVHGEHHGGHDAEHGAPAGAPAAGAHAHGGDVDAPVSGSPTLPHCALAAACMAPALASGTEPLPSLVPLAARVRAAQDGAPRSATTAPEPPPPRA